MQSHGIRATFIEPHNNTKDIKTIRDTNNNTINDLNKTKLDDTIKTSKTKIKKTPIESVKSKIDNKRSSSNSKKFKEQTENLSYHLTNKKQDVNNSTLLKNGDSNILNNKSFEKSITKQENIFCNSQLSCEKENAKHALKTDGMLDELRDKIENLQTNEVYLMKELIEQQKLSKDTLEKFANLQEESLKEIERVKEYYREYYKKRYEEENIHFQEDLQNLKNENQNLLKELKNLDTRKEVEERKHSITICQEILYLHEQIHQKDTEIESLLIENKELKKVIREHEKATAFDLKSLRNTLESLDEENRFLKSSQGYYNREDDDEKYFLKNKIEKLEDELIRKENLLKEKDFAYKLQLEQINENVYLMQKELAKLVESERKIHDLEQEIDQRNEELVRLKMHYKAKIQKQKANHERNKKDWSNIYDELLVEIRYLKGELQSYGIDNKHVLSSLNPKGFFNT